MPTENESAESTVETDQPAEQESKTYRMIKDIRGNIIYRDPGNVRFTHNEPAANTAGIGQKAEA